VHLAVVRSGPAPKERPLARDRESRAVRLDPSARERIRERSAVRSPAGSRRRICRAAGCVDSRARSRDRRLGADAGEILREAEIKRPVQSDADLLLESWQLAQINRAPKPPREEAREVDSRMLATPVRRPIATN
jgi:hypothetical protein